MDRLPGYSEETENRSLREEIERAITLALFVIAMVVALAADSKK